MDKTKIASLMYLRTNPDSNVNSLLPLRLTEYAYENKPRTRGEHRKQKYRLGMNLDVEVDSFGYITTKKKKSPASTSLQTTTELNISESPFVLNEKCDIDPLVDNSNTPAACGSTLNTVAKHGSQHSNQHNNNFNCDVKTTENSVLIEEKTEMHIDKEIEAERNSTEKTLPTHPSKLPLVIKEEINLRMIKTKSGRHVFEPAFYQVDHPTEYPEYQRRYIYERTLRSTLQGYACVVKDRVTNQKVAVKVASKIHITKKLAMTGTFVAEDFVKEIAILKKN